MNTLDGWGAEAINLMVNNPDFTILRNANANALVLFADGTHGVFLRADVDAAYRWIGSMQPDPRALLIRTTKPREFTWVPSDSYSECDLLPLVTAIPPFVPSDEFSSSSSSPAPAAHYPFIPRAPWMLEDDPRTDVEADADWKTAMERLLPSAPAEHRSHIFFPPGDTHRSPISTTRRFRLLSRGDLPLLPNPPMNRTPIYPTEMVAARTAMICAIDADHLLKHEPEPCQRPQPTKDYDSDDSLESYASTQQPRSRKPRADPAAEPPLHYASNASSVREGMASNAFCTVRDPTNPDCFATRSIIVGIDSYSDITVAHREIAYDIRRVCETVHTGARRRISRHR
jgi:hypothetical protein